MPATLHLGERTVGRAADAPRPWVGRLTVGGGVLGLWAAAAASGLLNTRLLPAPWDVGGALVEWSGDGLLGDVRASLTRVAVGFLLAAVVGISIGVLCGVFARLHSGLWLLELLRPIPPIAWLPLAILWFGVGYPSAVFIVFLAAFFPIVISTYWATTSVEFEHVNAARCLGARRGLLVAHVVVPSALPGILVGLRTGLGIGWMSLIAAELIAGRSGLGYMIQLNRIMLNMDRVVAGMLVIGALGMLMSSGLAWCGRALTPWRPETRRADSTL